MEKLLNTKYSWGNNNIHTIKFLENGEMDAFGKGNYDLSEPQVVQANFGSEKHKLTFNEDYTEFTSIREKDGEVIKGTLIEIKNNIPIPELIEYIPVPELVGKQFTWGLTNLIKFLEDGEMDAFGQGKYSLLKPQVVQANFGNESHTLTFNEDYTEFTSTREKDGEVIKGKLNEIKNNIPISEIIEKIEYIPVPELVGKQFTWGLTNLIKFLEDGEMDAFGQGKYILLKPQVVQANFGLEKHTLTFNEDYTEFTSTREKDGEVIQGKLIEIIEIDKLNYKQFLWNNTKILFVSGNNILLNGIRRYIYLSDKIIALNYNGDEYIFTFNDNYTSLNSKRTRDSMIEKGNLINKNY